MSAVDTRADEARAFAGFIAAYYARTHGCVTRARQARRAGLLFESSHLAECVREARASIRLLRAEHHLRTKR